MKVNITMTVAQMLSNLQGAQLPEKIIFEDITYTLQDDKYIDKDNNELKLTMQDYNKPVVIEDKLRVNDINIDEINEPTQNERIILAKLQELITVVNMICGRFDNE